MILRKAAGWTVRRSGKKGPVPGKAAEINKGGKMPPGLCRPARRERGAYPQRSATSEQRSWAAKEQGRLLPSFISAA
jgi:hypothetical protein